MALLLKQLPWLTIVALVFWHCFCGWVLSTIVSPPLYWVIAAMIASGLAVLVNIAWLLTLVPTLACGFLSVPFLLDAVIIRTNGELEELINIFSFENWKGGVFYCGLAFLLSVGWFSPLFWTKIELQRRSLTSDRSFWLITGCSWLGLFLGWCLGK